MKLNLTKKEKRERDKESASAACSHMLQARALDLLHVHLVPGKSGLALKLK